MSDTAPDEVSPNDGTDGESPLERAELYLRRYSTELGPDARREHPEILSLASAEAQVAQAHALERVAGTLEDLLDQLRAGFLTINTRGNS